MNARCRILATLVAPDAFRCPTTQSSAFHYHANVPGGTFVFLTGGAPCDHRHKSLDAARECSGAPGRPVSIARERGRRHPARAR
jgi:hypothetical protein